MESIVSSRAVRLVGLVLLAAAVALGPQQAAAAGGGKPCELFPFMACERCYDVEQYDGTICDVLTCVAGPTIHTNCR